jgi:hypothetical protein
VKRFRDGDSEGDNEDSQIAMQEKRDRNKKKVMK